MHGPMAVSLLVLIVAFYAAVATAHFEARRRREKPPRWARILGAVAVVLHFVGLYGLGVERGRSPFSTGAEALSFLGFSIAAVYLVLAVRSRVWTHGASFYGLATLLVALSVPGLVGAPTGDAEAVTRDAARTWHIGIGLLSTAAVLVCGLLAAGYLGTYFRAKRRELLAGTHGLSLTSFARLTRDASATSVALLAVSVALGVHLVMQADAPRGLFVLTLVTAGELVLLLAAFLTWWRRPVRGALAAWLNVAGVVVMIVALFVVHPLVIGGR